MRCGGKCTTVNSGNVLTQTITVPTVGTDYSAFGEEIGFGTGLRSIERGYAGDSPTRQGYGLTEKDNATGLDHTWFRKNENRAGRWTSPDPYKGSKELGNPQSFNRYSYVGNEPTNFVDPSGLLCYGWWVWRSEDGGESWYNTGIFIVDYCDNDGGGDSPSGGGTGGGGSGGGNNGGQQGDKVPPNCKDALKTAGLLNKVQKKLNKRFVDVDKISDRQASDFFGNDGTKDLTVGQYFDAQGHNAFTYRAGRTRRGKQIGRTGTYRRGGDAGVSIGERVHETAHRAQPLAKDLDAALVKLLKVDNTGKSNPNALSDYFNSGCDPKYLKK